MTQNLFEEFQEKKANLVKMTTKAVEFGWITPKRSQEIISKLDNDTLTIGVIGQMKCGKSTFLNSFVFEDCVLPAATTPMTAALSVITYGEQKKIVAEFYNKDEWSEQKLQASRSLEEVSGNSFEESKIKAAKELVEKSAKLGTELEKYLGKTQEDSFDNLEEYVGADGKYISITKSVTIYYPKEYLKGVEVVDTPGFNDPIISREERTKEFLKKADVVLLMLYAGRPFDATDRSILFKNVRQCGIGNVLIGINKYDIPWENGETEEEIKNYVKDEISKASKELGDDTLKEILKATEPIPLSAEMALLSEMPSSRIENDESLSFSWKRITGDLGISPNEIREKSHIDNLIVAIKGIIENEKSKILFAKPLNSIIAAGNNKMADIAEKLRLDESLLKGLNAPDDELDEKSEALSKVGRRLLRKIDVLEDDLNTTFRRIVTKGERTLEDDVDDACKKMNRIVDDWKITKNASLIAADLDNVKQFLVTRTLKNHIHDLSDEAQREISKCIDEFLEQAESILSRMPNSDDDNIEDLKKHLKNKLQLFIDEDVFKMDMSESDDDDGNILDKVCGFINGVYNVGTLGLWNKFVNALDYEENKEKLKDFINSLQREFDPKPFLETIYQNKDSVIEIIKTELLDKFITPMKKQIEDLRSKKEQKENKIQEAKDRINKMAEEKKVVTMQLNEFKHLKESFNL